MSFIKEVLAPVFIVSAFAIAIALIFGIAVAVSYGNARWNCSTWHANTGERTKVMAAECYVLEPAGWVSFGSHVKNHHVDVKN